MTTTLPSRATVLHDRLIRLDKMSSNVKEAGTLEGLRSELAPGFKKLCTQLNIRTLLVNNAITVAPPKALLDVRNRANGLLEKFTVDTTAATLKRGRGWSLLLKEVNDASRELESTVQSAWRGYCQNMFTGDTPDGIRTQLAPTKSNDDALELYETHFFRLKAAREKLPADQETIDNAQNAAVELEQAARAFDFDVPSDVKKFLEAVLSSDGAQLSLLTPSVEQWLKHNDSFNSYRIRSAGSR